MKVFLGGTCCESTWRERLKPLLKIEWFDPVVKDWTPECQEEERLQRKHCDFCLYVITPKMTGVYSIAEVTDDSNKRPEKTVFCFLKEDDEKAFEKFQIKSLTAVGKMVADNGGKVFESLEQIAEFLNNETKNKVICSKADECEARCLHKINHKEDDSCVMCSHHVSAHCIECKEIL